MKDLLKKLVKSDSTAEKGELAVAEIIAEKLTKSGIKSTIDRWADNRANIIAQINSTGQKPGLLFVCHLDVVPPGDEKWDFDPFAGSEKDGKILGRGATDMKGGTAAIVTAIKEIVESDAKLKGDIILAATAGEETDGCGVIKFLQQQALKMPKLAGIIIPEPTDFNIVTSHRGILWLEITTKGKTAHGSMPQAGINAISSMVKLIEELENFKTNDLPEDCSMSINTIEAGKAINVVPDSCTIGVDIRLMFGQSHEGILNSFEKIFAKLKQNDPNFNASIEIKRHVDGLKTDNDCEFVRQFCSTVEIDKTISVGFTTDGSHLTKLNVPIVIFGPGKGGLCHKPNEYIELTDVQRAVEYYKNIIMQFLA